MSRRKPSSDGARLADQRRVREGLRALPDRPPPADFADGVMARILARSAEPAASAPPHRSRRWPRVAALAAMLVLIGAAALVGYWAGAARTAADTPPARPPAPAAATAPQPAPTPAVMDCRSDSDAVVLVRFSVHAPQARSVEISGDFTRWRKAPIAMLNRGDGTWIASVKLPRGTYQYGFLIDGTTWTPDPRADSRRPDGFGGFNSVLRL